MRFFGCFSPFQSLLLGSPKKTHPGRAQVEPWPETANATIGGLFDSFSGLPESDKATNRSPPFRARIATEKNAPSAKQVGLMCSSP